MEEENHPATLETISEQLRTMSEQQIVICSVLNEIVGALNQEADGSLIDELSELFAPLFKDVQSIKNKLGLSAPSTDDSTQDEVTKSPTE